MITIKLFNEQQKVNKLTTIEELTKKYKEKYYVAKVDNRLRELTYKLEQDATVELLDLTYNESCRVYENTLRYLFVYALYKLYPNAKVVFNYSISRAIYCKLTNLPNKIDNNLVNKITEEIKNLISLNLPIERIHLSKEEAKKIYEHYQFEDKIKNLKYRPENMVHLYKCGDYHNYMFGYMLPNTNYIDEFNLRLYNSGILLQYPRSENQGQIPEFEDAAVYSQTLIKANKWAEICDANYIYQVNEKFERNQEIDFINLCETKHNNMLADLGNIIKNDIENIRLIAIAGPSSSGKTTFSNRLRIELLSKGIKPLMISIDDYYLGKHQAPKDIDGKPDLEHIQALDIELFNEHIFSLVSGEEVSLVHFNFQTGLREIKEKIRIDEKTVIIIEGIHALNDLLTPSIANHQKFKIYIAPQMQIHIDDHNPLSLTDIRLIRRLVRDFKYRNSSATNTLDMWQSVRRGEFKWIYPNQENADYVFNSELTYELCVLKKYALPLLKEIDVQSEHYITANRLIKSLKYFKDLDETYVPCNSILREFIGGSCFYRN